MQRSGKRTLITGGVLMALFILWTGLIGWVDVRAIGPRGSAVGFATLNGWFHRLTGVHMTLYHITDWMGLVPVAVGFAFAILGLCQWIHRRRIWRVDGDILILGIYYLVVLGGYLLFEAVPVNYRPILINDFLEASYPSSTTLLVVGVMPTLWEQVSRRVKAVWINRLVAAFVIAFSAFMVVGRWVSGVHWFTDIIGALLLAGGLFTLYWGAVQSLKK